MKISLIIVNYNGKKFLPRLIDSMQNQTVKPFEIILVDNASTDDSIDVIKKSYPEVRCIPTENNGYGMAVNLGVRHAKGEYVMFFNEDMYLPTNYLEELIEFRKKIEKKDPCVAAIGCKIIPFDTESGTLPDNLGGQLDLFGYPTDVSKKNEHLLVINGCPFFISRSLFLEMQGFHPGIFLYGDDSDLCWRMKLFGYSCYIDNNTHAYHYGGGVTGGFHPKKVGYIIYGGLVAMLTNYSLVSLFFLMPFYFVYYIFIHIGLFVVFKGNIDFNMAFLNQTLRVFKDWSIIWRMRDFVQKNRIVSDLDLFAYFSIIPAPIRNIIAKGKFG